MAGKQIDPKRIDQYVKLIGQGRSMNESAREAGISYSTIMRMMKDPLSPINTALGDRGLGNGGVATRERYGIEAERAFNDFGYFRERYLARTTSPWAEDAAMKILELAATPFKEYVVINVAPGVGKSTLFVHDIPCWLAVRDRATRQMIGSSTQKLANMYTGRLRNTFERTTTVKADSNLVALGMAKDAVSTLSKDYGRFRPYDGGLWRREEFILAQPGNVAVEGKESSFAAFGMDTKFLGGRFDEIWWDDLVTNATLKTEDARNTLITLWEGEAEPRLEPGGLLVLQGQRLGANDLYRYCLDLRDHTEIDMRPDEQPRKYHHIVYKAHYEEKCQGEHEQDAPAWPKGCLLDPFRLTWRDLMRVKTNKEDKFRVLYQQEDTDPENALVQRAWIDGGIDAFGKYAPGCWDEKRSIGVVPDGVQGFSVMTVDPSPSKYWAIGWWIYDPVTQNQYLIDMERRPMDAPDFIDWNKDDNRFTGLLEDWYRRSWDAGHTLTHLIVEANAAQRFMLQYDHFKRWSSWRSVDVTAHQTTRNKSDEEFGVQTIAPHYRFGRVRLPGNQYDGSRQRVMQLVKEVCAWPNGSTDDCVMMHWFLVWNAQYLFADANIDAPRFDVPSWVREKAI